MKILIAEDDAPSRMLLKKNLEKWGYEVIATEDGNQALDAIQKETPDIAILDWMMPGLSGIDLCEKIRSAENVPYIYIILLTAKSQSQDMLTGFNVGADDYIVKPFDRNILHSRIAVGARIIEYDKKLTNKTEQLRQHSCEMEQLAQDRSKQLIHAERMATVGLLSAGIAHEINNPTAFISGNIQTIEKFWKDIESTLKINNNDSLAGKLEFILEEMPNTIDGIRNGVDRISKIVNGLKSFCRKDHGNATICDVNACIEQSLELCHNALKYNIKVEKNLDDTQPQIKADPQQMEQVFINLLTNAADAIGKKDGIITIETKIENDIATITIGDNGTGIDEDKLNDIWQPFFTTKPVGSGTGLGLSTVLGIIENHNGKITIENKPSGGALFTISLPILLKGYKNESKITSSR